MQSEREPTTQAPKDLVIPPIVVTHLKKHWLAYQATRFSVWAVNRAVRKHRRKMLWHSGAYLQAVRTRLKITVHLREVERRLLEQMMQAPQG